MLDFVFCNRLFVLPQYDSSLIEQSLLLNRRRNEPEHQKNKLEEHFEDLDIIDGMAAFCKWIFYLF
jgi:hypothetical protein